VPTPRNIAFDDEYAYVSSWAGAYYGGDARKGAVYRIDLSTKTVKDTVNVGYQPEGLVAVDGNLYVANSGGVNPNGYENSVSIINTANFKVTGDITLPTHKNLQSIVADDDGNIWVSSFGDYYSVHSGFAKIDLATNEVTEINTTVSTDLWFDQYSKRILFIGSDKEWDWTATDKQYTLYFYNKELDRSTGIVLGSGSLKDIKHPYAVASDPQTGDLFIGDSSDGKSPGTLFYLSESNTAMYAIRWSATAGLFPGHFAFYSR
jgi:hypothetical protein